MSEVEMFRKTLRFRKNAFSDLAVKKQERLFTDTNYTHAKTNLLLPFL